MTSTAAGITDGLPVPSEQETQSAAPGPALVGLVALLTLMVLEAVRFSGPLLDVAFSFGGATAAAEAALTTYAASGVVAGAVLLAARRGLAGSGSSVLLLGAGCLGGLRVAVQILAGGARFAVGLATVAVAVAVLTLAVALLAGRPGGGRAAAGAMSAGAAGGVGLQLVLGTWDSVWRHTIVGWCVTGTLVACLLGLAAISRRSAPPAPSFGLGRVWAVGPFLGLGAMMLANPAFAASQSGLPLAVAGPVHGTGLLIASATVVLHPGLPARWAPGWWRRSARWRAAATLVLFVAAGLSLPTPVGIIVLAALLGAQIAATRLLSRALESTRATTDIRPEGAPAPRTPGSRRFVALLAGTASLVGLGTIVPLLVYQIDYDTPLGFPNAFVFVATAAALAAAGIGRSGVGWRTAQSSRAPGWSVLAATSALLLVGTVVANAESVVNHAGLRARPVHQAAGTGRLMSWNLHYGVSPGGSVDLETTARTIEAHNLDAVVLQEVSRGWVLGGGADMATWLSNRLGRQFVFAPAADGRFGNVIMSRDRPTDVEVFALPYGAGPQHRSAISAQVRLGGQVTRVVSVHLQQRASNTPTRILELESLLADLEPSADGSATVVGGDFNAQPGWREISMMTDAGFVSSIDKVGDPDALTEPTTAPRRRIDWIFGRGVGFAAADVLVDAQTSDHLPLVIASAR